MVNSHLKISNFMTVPVKTVCDISVCFAWVL